MQLGKDISLTADGNTLLGLTSANFSINGETIDITTLDSNQMADLLSGKKDASLELSGLRNDAAANSLNDMLDAAVAAQKVAIVITYAGVAIGDRETISLTMLVESYSEEANDNAPVSQSATLQSDGEPTFTNRAA